MNSKTRSSYVFLGPGYKFYAPLATFVAIKHKKRKLLRKVFANHEDLRTAERQYFSEKIEFCINLKKWGNVEAFDFLIYLITGQASGF